WKEADTPPRRSVPKRLTEHRPAAARGAHKPHRDVQRCRLASAVRTEKPEYLSWLHAERKVAQCFGFDLAKQAFVALRHPIELERGCHDSILTIGNKKASAEAEAFAKGKSYAVRKKMSTNANSTSDSMKASPMNSAS